MTEQKKPRKRKVSQTESGEAPLESKESKGINMDAISQEWQSSIREDRTSRRRLDDAQKSSDYETFQKIGNSYLGTILESINLYIDLIKEIQS